MSNIWHEIETRANELNFEDSAIKREWMDQKFKEEMGKLGQTLVDSLNTMGCTELATEGLVQGILQTHRYLQGEFWTVMVNVIKAYGKTEYFDGRNEFAVEMCKRMGESAFK